MPLGKTSGVLDLLLGDRYKATKRIGGGSFGDIYLGHDTITGKDVAVKVEPLSTLHPQLAHEAKIYKLLNKKSNSCVPHLHWTGIAGDYTVMVIDLLGPSLEDLFQENGGSFSLKTVVILAIQLLSCIENIHAINYLHRDIKPDNFLIGLEAQKHIVYMIDFGLCKRYMDPISEQHIPYRDNKCLVGTARYASINTHIEQSRRDDLESIGYVLLYFLLGSLPWQGLKASNNKQKYEKISERKMATPVRVLCKGQPLAFEIYLNYVKGLRFDVAPEYHYCIDLFTNLQKEMGHYPSDYIYDWSSPIMGSEKREREEDEKPNSPSMKIAKASPQRAKPHKGRLTREMARLSPWDRGDKNNIY
eukprot:Ihof_evm8s111 gene=Ihof_evmTU8s111